MRQKKVKGIYIDNTKVITSDSMCLHFLSKKAISINNMGPDNYTNFQITNVNHINIMEAGSVKKVRFCPPENIKRLTSTLLNDLSIEYLHNQARRHINREKETHCMALL